MSLKTKIASMAAAAAVMVAGNAGSADAGEKKAYNGARQYSEEGYCNLENKDSKDSAIINCEYLIPVIEKKGNGFQKVYWLLTLASMPTKTPNTTSILTVGVRDNVQSEKTGKNVLSEINGNFKHTNSLNICEDKKCPTALESYAEKQIMSMLNEAKFRLK